MTASVHERVATPPLVAFAVAVLGVAIFSVMDAAMKSMVLTLGAYTTLLWRNLAGTVMSGAIYWSRARKPVTGAALRVHVLRGVVSTVMAVTFFWGLARVPMAQAIALTFIAPLLSLFLAAAMLGEKIRRLVVLGSAIAFAGVALIFLGQWRSAVAVDTLHGTFAVLASAGFYAFNIVLMRRQALVADPVEVAFSQSLIVTLALATGAPFFATLPTPGSVPLLVFAAALSVVSLLLMAWAYARSGRESSLDQRIHVLHLGRAARMGLLRRERDGSYARRGIPHRDRLCGRGARGTDGRDSRTGSGPMIASNDDRDDDRDDDREDTQDAIHEARLWHDDGWTARVIKNEDDEGWAVEMIKDGEPEPALVGPWTMGRDKKNPKPLDTAAFITLVKTAAEVLRRHEQQAHAERHRRVTVNAGEDRIVVTLDIVADDDDPYATLAAIDQSGDELASVRVAAGFRLTAKSASDWIESGFRRPE